MLPEVNLLPKYERSESVLFNAFVIGLTIIVLLSAVLGFFYLTTKNTLEEVEDRRTALSEEKYILETRLETLESDQTASSRKEVVSFIENFRLPTSVLVDEFIQLLPPDAYLSTYTFDYHTVSIQSQFETLPVASAYLTSLISSPYFDSVLIEDVASFTAGEASGNEEGIDVFGNEYEEILRYNIQFTAEVNHQRLAGEEENNETAFSGK